MQYPCISEVVLKEWPHAVLGNPDGPTLVFIAGFPDDMMSAWAELFDKLKGKYKILTICFPQFDKGSPIKPWGYDLDTLVSMLENTLSSHIDKDDSFPLIAHDWGAVISYLYAQKNPNRVSRLVCIDVGFGYGKETPWDYFLSYFYRIWLCVAYIFSQLFGTFIGSLAFFALFAVFKYIPLLSPTAGSTKERVKRPFKEIHVNMAYPYYYLIKAQLFGKSLSLAQFPVMPFLYLYGRDKQVMFHNHSFLSRIEHSPHSKVQGYDCGHWVQHAFPEEVARDIDEFVSL